MLYSLRQVGGLQNSLPRLASGKLVVTPSLWRHACSTTSSDQAPLPLPPGFDAEEAEGMRVEAVDVKPGPSRRGGTKKPKLRAIRQHVNPLASTYMKPLALPQGWLEENFPNPSLPFHIDIGSARGRFVIEMAKVTPDVNFLGLEIRRPCVEESFKKKEKAGVNNIHFLACNANVDLQRVMDEIRKHSLIQTVTIQYPDPHFKKKHRKRRVVQPSLVTTIADGLAEEGRLFLQSDVLEVAEDMRESFQQEARLTDTHEAGVWISENPLPVPTERETLTLSKGLPVYRALLIRKKVDPPPGL